MRVLYGMRLRWVIPTIPCLLAAAACGGMADTAPSGPSPPSARLEIVIQPGFVANAHTQRYRLTCNPSGGSLPHAAAACAVLARDPHLLDPLPACSKVLPDTGSRTITGSFAGKAVHLRFSCPAGTRRWGRLASLLGLTQKGFG